MGNDNGSVFIISWLLKMTSTEDAIRNKYITLGIQDTLDKSIYLKILEWLYYRSSRSVVKIVILFIFPYTDRFSEVLKHTSEKGGT